MDKVEAYCIGTLGLILGIFFTYFCLASVMPVQVIEVPTFFSETIVQTVEVPVIVTETRVVEVPVLINHTTLKIIEIPVIVKEYVPQNRTLRHFETLQKLQVFLRNDNTDSINYSSNFNCDEYAWRLIDAAEAHGYRMAFLWEHDMSSGYSHALCIAYVENMASYLKIEPQTDGYSYLWADDG